VKDPCFQIHQAWNVEAFRNAYPDFRLTYLDGCGMRVEGTLAFSAVKEGYEPIEDEFELRWDVLEGFPKRIPLVFETKGRIPVGYHKLENGALCLGSPIRQRMILADHPTLSGFVEDLVVPYLYNRSYFEKHDCLPVGELEHGSPGLIEDYQQLFGVESGEACLGMLQMLGLKKRNANKKPCPCGSGLRVGKCHNKVLKPFRNLATRRYFQEHGMQIQKQFRSAGERLKIG
jgi:hypothetical protein